MERADIPGEVRERHRAFWEMEAVDKPLLSIGRYQPLQQREPFPLADGTVTEEGALVLPARVDAQRLAQRSGQPSAAVRGGFVHGPAPYDLCWNEAIAGCPIRWSAGYVWSEPCLESLDESERLRVRPDNAWLGKLREVTRLLAERAGGRYPVCQPLLRGPIDIAAAALGDARLCWAVADEPAGLRRLLEVCTELFIAVARAWQAEAPPFAGGYCEYGIWAPGTAVRTQADNASLLSPRAYREFLLPCDARICAAFDYPLIHTHSGVLPILVDALLDLEPLRAVQVSLDYPAGPPVVELLPLLKRLNERKPLIITGPVTEQELALLLLELSPRGLCLQVAVRGDAE